MQGEQDRACLSRDRWIHKPGGQVRGLSWRARGHQPLGTGKNRRSTACIPEHTSKKRSRGTRKGGKESSRGEDKYKLCQVEKTVHQGRRGLHVAGTSGALNTEKAEHGPLELATRYVVILMRTVLREWW